MFGLVPLSALSGQFLLNISRHNQVEAESTSLYTFYKSKLSFFH